MQVQVLELTYDNKNIKQIENQLNNYLSHHEVTDVQIVRAEDQILAFCFAEE